MGMPKETKSNRKLKPFLIGLVIIGSLYYVKIEAENFVKSSDSKEDTQITGISNLLHINSPIEITEQDYLASKNMYRFNQMDENQKQIYTEIYKGLSNMETSFIVSCKDRKEVEQLIDNVLSDHPDIFYFEGGQIVQDGQELGYVEVQPEYTMTRDLRDGYQRQIDSVCADFLRLIPDNADDYTKVKTIYKLLISNVDYDLNAKQNQNIISVFLNKATVCHGYASAMSYMLNKVGIESTIVTGKTMDTGENHAWNLVKEDGEYYFVDTTWGNSQFENSKGRKFVDYAFLNVTSDSLSKTHVIGEELPYCTCGDNNYFRREKLYFDDVEESLVLTNYLQKSGDFISVQYGDRETLKHAITYFFDAQQLCNYIDFRGSVQITYVPDYDYNILTVFRD